MRNFLKVAQIADLTDGGFIAGIFDNRERVSIIRKQDSIREGSIHRPYGIQCMSKAMPFSLFNVV